MNKSKFFGARPILYFAEPAAGGDGAGAGSGGGDGSAGAGAGAGGSEPSAPISDETFLAQGGEKPATAIVKTEEKKETPAEAPGAEIVKLDALEEGDPEWFATVKDAKAAAAIRELLNEKKAFSEHFKTTQELQEFFKDLPGGRDQVSALLTLGKEVGELDTAIEGNDFAGHITVAERVLNQAPDNALSMTRAWAQTVAKHQPEAWQAASMELINSTLKAAGIGADMQTLLGAIREMRAAVAADDAEAFGLASQKLLGTPAAEAKEDPLVAKAKADAATATTERDKALSKTWDTTAQSNIAAVEQMIRQEIGTKLSQVLTDSTSQATRDKLMGSRGKDGKPGDGILGEIDSQMGANAWLRSQIQAIIGSYQQMNLRATPEDFAKVLELSKNAAKPLISAAVRKIVSAWAKEVAATNQDARDKAKGTAIAKADIGGGSTAKNGKGVVTEEMVRDPNVSDEDLLRSFSAKR